MDPHTLHPAHSFSNLPNLHRHGSLPSVVHEELLFETIQPCMWNSVRKHVQNSSALLGSMDTQQIPVRDTQTHRHTDKQTHRQADRQAGRQAGRQKQTNKLTKPHTPHAKAFVMPNHCAQNKHFRCVLPFQARGCSTNNKSVVQHIRRTLCV